MKTLESRIELALREEANRLPDLDEALILVAQPARAKRRHVLAWTAAGVAAVVLVALPLLYQSAPLGTQAERRSAETTVPAPVTSTVAGDPDGSGTPIVAPQIVVTEIQDPGLPRDQPPPQRLEAAVAAAGGSYEDPPGRLQDVASRGERIVIATQPEGVFYSDGGPWGEVSYELPSEVRLGTDIGKHIFDGITNIAATHKGFLAWGWVTAIRSLPIGLEGSLESAGTLILVSEDNGRSWRSLFASDQVTHFLDFEHGYLAVFSTVEPDEPSSVLMWSSDLVNWTELHDLGSGLVFAFQPGDANDSSVVAGVHYWETTTGTNPDGSTYSYVVAGSEKDIWYTISPIDQ